MTRWKALGPAIIAVALVAACASSNPSPAAGVRAAGVKTLAAKTVAVAVTLTNPAVAQQPSTGTGAYDLVANRGEYNPLTLYGVPGIPDGSSVAALLQLPTVYAQLGDLGKKLSIKTPWVKIDLRILANLPGLDLGTIAEARSANPRQFLLFLAGATQPATRVGNDTIGGTRTTHYQVSCDLTQAVKGLSGDDAVLLNTAANTYTSAAVPADIWTDAQGLIRRMVFKLTVKGANGKAPTSQTVQFDFTGFGVPVNATAPPDNQVTDIAGLLQAIAGSATSSGG